MPTISRKCKEQAFSLVELSIVLVILGLLTGGILTGQSLIRAAELRAVATEAEQFVTGVNTFKGKYFALPGDMTNATQFWGDNNTYCADAAITNGSPGTCNGNGDGIIDVGSTGNQQSEIFMFWNQLAYAGLIEGQYSGVSGSGGVWHSTINQTGQNSPASKLSGGAYIIFDNPGLSGSSFWLDGDYINDLIFAAPNPPATEGGILAAEEVWGIDKKLDDGHPGRGKLNIGRWQACTTPASGADNSANRNISYDLNNANKDCALIMVDRF